MYRFKTLATLFLLIAMTAGSALAQNNPMRRLFRQNSPNGLSQGRAPGANGLGNNPFLLIDYPGGIANQFVAGINDQGKMVGIVGFADGSFRGYQLQGTTFKDIVYPGSGGTGAFGINKSGLIVGFYCDLGCNTTHGFTLKGKTYTTLDVPGGMNTAPNGVNSAGDIAGTYQSPDGAVHGFLLHKGAYTTIDMPGSTLTEPLAINKQGTIVGICFLSGDTAGGHGFILQNGVFTQVDYPGAYGTGLDGINDSGDIVGGYAEAEHGPNHGFLLSGGVYTVFDVPFPGQIATDPSGLNNHHQIVGSYGSFPPDYFFGFLTTY